MGGVLFFCSIYFTGSGLIARVVSLLLRFAALNFLLSNLHRTRSPGVSPGRLTRLTHASVNNDSLRCWSRNGDRR